PLPLPLTSPSSCALPSLPHRRPLSTTSPPPPLLCPRRPPPLLPVAAPPFLYRRRPSLSPSPPPQLLPRDPDSAGGATTRPSDTESDAASFDAMLRFEAVSRHMLTPGDTTRRGGDGGDGAAADTRSGAWPWAGAAAQAYTLGRGATKPTSACNGHWDATRWNQPTVAASAARTPWSSSTESPVSQQTHLHQRLGKGSMMLTFPSSLF
ncbi:unnamed protein product, partial [Urochloa humidicola]